MKSNTQFNLKSQNTFAVKSVTPQIHILQYIDDLKLLPDLSQEHFYILGEGSNSLFVDSVAPVILKPEFKGLNITELTQHYLIEVAAGENWHELVEFCTKNGYSGLENLALIPGSVGAAPVQNIGAYGVELSDFCTQVLWYEFSTQKIIRLTQKQCQFSYRHSVFKEKLKNKGLILQISLLLPKQWSPVLNYQGLDKFDDNVQPATLMNAVIELRAQKLPDPKKIGNAGSFFKNPEISHAVMELLKQKYPQMPIYSLGERKYKLAAGWLIEQCGLKGYRTAEGVGIHEKQALVLVNYSSEKGKDIVALAKYVQNKVKEKFGVILIPEVRAIYQHGEQPMKLDNTSE